MNAKYKSFVYNGEKIETEQEITNKLSSNKNLKWLIYCEFEDADIEIENDTIIWKGGNFYSGEWRYGIWKEGNFYGGIWYSGIWEGGNWNGGKWKDGIGNPNENKKELKEV